MDDDSLMSPVDVPEAISSPQRSAPQQETCAAAAGALPSRALRLQWSLPSTVPRALLRRNLQLLNAFSFFIGLAFLSPIWVLHVRASLAERATRTSLVLAAQTLACCAMELPAGIVADLCGRKQCLLACAGVRMLGLILLAALEATLSDLSPLARLVAFSCVAALEGVAQALANGADVALLHDTLTALGRGKEFQQQLSNRCLLWPLAAALANLAGAALADAFGIEACVWASVVATIVALLAAAAMTEVYPRIYSLRRIWRKRQQKSPSAVADAAEHSSSSLATACPDEPELDTPVSSHLRSRKSVPVTHIQPAAKLSPRKVLVQEGDPDAASSDRAAVCPPQRCPSPLSSLPPHSLDDFLSLLRAHLSQCTDTLRLHPPLRKLLLLSAALYGFSEPAHRMRAVLLSAHALPPSMLGFVGAGVFGLSALGAAISPRILSASAHFSLRDGASSVLLWSSILPPLLQFLACSMSSGMGTASCLLVGSLLWGIRTPILAHMLHEHVTCSNQRATVASVQSLLNKLALVTHIRTHALQGEERTRLISLTSECVLLCAFLSISQSACLTCVAGPLSDAWSIDASVRVLALLSLAPIAPLMACCTPAQPGGRAVTCT